ncbi:MAG: hypothetical protein M9942_05855 [Microthrixaceae bacterium]|nr:hypothetical protein [Microthrixaceae bacterium]MCO5317947.1 hypothetical protein [Microthrixaceae bacterium]
MTADPSSSKRRGATSPAQHSAGGRARERPSHPKRAATILMVAVVVLLVLVAAVPLYL